MLCLPVRESHCARALLCSPAQLVARVMLDLVIAQGTCIFTALVVLPSFASVELRGNVARALSGVAQSVSRYSSRLLEPQDPLCLYVPPSKSKTGKSPAPPHTAAPSVTSDSTTLHPVPAAADAADSHRQALGAGTPPDASAYMERLAPSASGDSSQLLDEVDMLVQAQPDEVADQALALARLRTAMVHEVDVLGGDLQLHDEEVDEETYKNALRQASKLTWCRRGRCGERLKNHRSRTNCLSHSWRRCLPTSPPAALQDLRPCRPAPPRACRAHRSPRTARCWGAPARCDLAWLLLLH